MKNVADQIGTLRAQIAALEDELEVIEKAVKFEAPVTMEGELYHVKAFESTSVSLSWKDVAMKIDKLKATRIAKRLRKSKPITKLTCTAKIKSKKAA